VTIARAVGLSVARGGRTVLRDVDIELAAGELVALVGPNGGGKTTLLLALAGLVPASAGRVEVRGRDAVRVAVEQRGSVGLLTAAPGLYPLLTGWENLVFFGALHGLGEAEVRARVRPFAEELGVALDARVGAGSSGQQQKVSLARALLVDPPLLLLDEPTAHLDPLSAERILAAARARADSGRAVVWVTHDLAAAETLCDRAVLVAGTVAATLRFEGTRTLPPRGTLTRAWAERVGAPA
jgi:ABC-2 type transport system ATP-binding protein